MYRSDGSVVSANTPQDGNIFKEEDFAIYRCLVIKTYYTDDNNNISSGAESPEVVYDCKIIGGFREGAILPNCRVAGAYGGQFNYSERIFRASPGPTGGSKAKPLNQQEGDIVYVGFLNGDPAYPVILGGGNHQLDGSKTGAAAADGPRVIEEYNGVIRNINKDGEFKLTRQGGEFQEDHFVPAEGMVEATFEMNIDEILLKDGNDNTVQIDKAADALNIKINKTVTQDVGEGAVTQVTDKETESIITSFKSGLEMVYDGMNDKVEYTTAGGMVLQYDGQNDLVKFEFAGGSIIEADGAGKTIKITAQAGTASVEIDGNSGEIKLVGNLVDLGAAVSDFVVLGTKLITAFNTHTHQYIAPLIPAPTNPVPTQPPTTPMPISVLSQTVKVQP